MNRRVGRAALVCAIFSSVAAFGQVETESHETLEVVGFPSLPTYGSRAIGIVYDNLSNTFGQTPARWTSVTNMRHILEDISFVPGPWANATSRVITSMTWGRRTAAGTGLNTDVLFRFWDRDDVAFAGFMGTGTGMINPSAVPIAEVRIQIRNLNQVNAGATQATVSLTGLPGGGVSIPDDSFYLEGVFVDPDTTTIRSDDQFRFAIASNSAAPTGGNAATVGTTLRDIGWDADQNGQFTGQPAFGTPERYSYSVNSMAAGYMVRFSGDIPPQPPPSAIDLGCIPDTGATRAGDVLGDASVLWYQVCLAAPATDAAYAFIDLDTEGSTADTAMAIFDSTGVLITSDADGGSAGNPHLTFGIGRRAAVGDGQQYDGRHGQLAAGTYYVAVGPQGTTFGDGFTANASGVGGLVSLNIATNINGTPPAPPVAPLINHQDYGAALPGGPIGFPDARQGVAMTTGLRGMRWSTFEVSAEAGSGSSYLDIDFARLCAPGFNPVAYLFDSAGDFVAYSDNDGPTNFPQFSFGAGSGSRTYGANPVAFSGSNGNLQAGRYYMAVALSPTQDVRAHPAGARFHVRGTSGSNANVGADIFTGGEPAGLCDPDVNCDGSADGFDVEAMEQAVGGDMTNFCQVDPDFNGDGSVDGFDIEAVERVVGGAPCP